MLQPDRRSTRSQGKGETMNVIAHLPLETLAVDAVRLGRRLAAEWPDAAVENTASMDALIARSLARLGAGEVFATSDDDVLSLMLGAVRQTLNSYREGYGDYFMREPTAEHPFYDVEQDRVRRVGELLKGFLEARQGVLDRVIAERQVLNLRRR